MASEGLVQTARPTYSSDAVTLRFTSLVSVRRAVVVAWPLVMLLPAACGSGQAPVKTAHDESASDDSGLSDGTESAAESPLLDCSDGTCARCGDGICTRGAYCNESAVGGPACSWLPECPEAPDCECIERVFGSKCDCEEQDGTAHVSCRE